MLKNKIQNALDEARILVLGAQVLMGFQYNSVFQKGFEQLPLYVQYLKIGALGMLIVAFGLLTSPCPYHQIVNKGKDSQSFNRYITKVLGAALLPFALGLGIDLFVASQKLIGTVFGIIAGIVATLAALSLWYGLEIVTRKIEKTKQAGQGGLQRPVDGQADPHDKEGESSMKLEDRVKQVLTETRVVIPGAQALLGFQFIAMLTDAFDKLPASSKYVHLVSLALIALSTMLLMTPAAYHRIVEQGEDTERFVRLASRMMVSSMVPLALGIVGDFFVVVRKVTDSLPLSLTCALLMLIFFYGLWFGFTFLQRKKTFKNVEATTMR